MPSSFLDTVDEFFSKYGSPLGLAQSTILYDEPPLWRYDDQVPPPVPPFSLFDIAYTVFFYLFAFGMICAALLPTYLAFESEIWAVMQPLIDLMDAIHESFQDRVPLEINRYDFLVPEIVKTQTAGLSKAIVQQSTWFSQQGLAGFKTFMPAPTKLIDVAYVQRMLAEIKSHSESHYSDLMLDFKICQQMRSRGLEATTHQQRKALRSLAAQRDAAAARYWALFRKQPAIRQEYTRMAILVFIICQSEHTKVLDNFRKTALEVEDLHKQELAGKAQEFSQLSTRCQHKLAAKDESARQQRKEHRQQMKAVTSAHEAVKQELASLKQQHESLKKRHNAEIQEYIEQHEADTQEREDYIRASENIAAQQDQEHTEEIEKLQADHAAEMRSLELRVKNLSNKCKWVNFLRKTSEEQNVQATTLRQLNEAESALRDLLDRVKPAMKRLGIDRNKQTQALRDVLSFAVDLWQNYLHLSEALQMAPSPDLSECAELYLGLNKRGEKTRETNFYPILDVDSLLGIFHLPGVRRAGDPPRLTSLAWGAMQPAVDAPAETFIEWLVEADFTEDRWRQLRHLAYKLAKVDNTFKIREILVGCHILRRSDRPEL